MGDSPAHRQELSVLHAPTEPAGLGAAFDEMMRAECPYVWTSLRRLGVPAADCEDLMQEVFCRVYLAFATLDRSRPVRPWLFGFAMRVASEHRRLARHKREVREERELADAAPGADDELALAQRRRVVARALESVDLDKRAVLILHELDDVAAPEIARSLGLPEGTVYSRLKAGRAQLAAAIRRIVARGGLP
jgi:RNA polymerase sigma-70 factor (ECF subfamily)